jgi:hypothetical protein
MAQSPGGSSSPENQLYGNGPPLYSGRFVFGLWRIRAGDNHAVGKKYYLKFFKLTSIRFYRKRSLTIELHQVAISPEGLELRLFAWFTKRIGALRGYTSWDFHVRVHPGTDTALPRRIIKERGRTAPLCGVFAQPFFCFHDRKHWNQDYIFFLQWHSL